MKIKLKIDKYVYGGDAMGRLEDGRVAFVPFALPGEEIKANIIEDKKGFVRAEFLEVLKRSPQRIEPRCKHYTKCGGCHYQHLSYQEQLEVKTEIVLDALQRIGGLEDISINPIISSDIEWNYRNNVQFHLNQDGVLGFMAGRSDTVVPIEECHLLSEVLTELWPSLALEPNPDIKRVSLRVGQDDDVMLIFETFSDEALEFSVDFPISAVQLGSESYYVLSGDDFIHTEVLGKSFRVTANAFFQVNSSTAEKMVNHLLEILPLDEDMTVLDLYCGVGFFSAFIAPKVSKLIGIESHPQASEDFVFNLDEFDNIELYEGKAKLVMKGLEVNPDIIVVDPPRSGLGRHVLDAIVELAPKHLAYISCDPATLARDAKRLTAKGYSLQQITPIDMFPQTFHIETISLWVTKK